MGAGEAAKIAQTYINMHKYALNAHIYTYISYIPIYPLIIYWNVNFEMYSFMNQVAVRAMAAKLGQTYSIFRGESNANSPAYEI